MAAETRPDTPVSISSKIIVPTGSTRLKIDLRARINLDCSPPETIFTNGIKSSPGLGAIKKTIESVPFSVKVLVSSKLIENLAFSIYKSANSCFICSSKECATRSRVRCSSRAFLDIFSSNSATSP